MSDAGSCVSVVDDRVLAGQPNGDNGTPMLYARRGAEKQEALLFPDPDVLDPDAAAAGSPPVPGRPGERPTPSSSSTRRDGAVQCADGALDVEVDAGTAGVGCPGAGTSACSWPTSPGPSGWGATSSLMHESESCCSLSEKVAQLQEVVKIRLRAFEDEQQRQWSHVQKALGDHVASLRDVAERAVRRHLDVEVERLREDFRDSAAHRDGEVWAEVESLRLALEQQQQLQGQAGSLRSVLMDQAAELRDIREDLRGIGVCDAYAIESQLEPLRQEVGNLMAIVRGRSAHLQLAQPEALGVGAAVVAKGGCSCGCSAGRCREGLRRVEDQQGGLGRGLEELRAQVAAHGEQLCCHSRDIQALRTQLQTYGEVQSEVSRGSLALAEAVLKMAPTESVLELEAPRLAPWGARHDRLETLREETMRHLARLALRVEVPLPGVGDTPQSPLPKAEAVFSS